MTLDDLLSLEEYAGRRREFFESLVIELLDSLGVARREHQTPKFITPRAEFGEHGGQVDELAHGRLHRRGDGQGWWTTRTLDGHDGRG